MDSQSFSVNEPNVTQYWRIQGGSRELHSVQFLCHFHAVFANILSNNRLAHPWEILDHCAVFVKDITQQNGSNWVSIFYCSPTKLRKGNVFRHVCLFTGAKCHHFPWCIWPHCKGPSPWALNMRPHPALAPLGIRQHWEYFTFSIFNDSFILKAKYFFSKFEENVTLLSPDIIYSS